MYSVEWNPRSQKNIFRNPNYIVARTIVCEELPIRFDLDYSLPAHTFTMTAAQTTFATENESNDLTLMESMLLKEQTSYAQHDFFARPTPISPNFPDRDDTMATPVDHFCRNIMAKWCINLCKFCSYDRGMVASVMSCVDRFVATPEGAKTLQNRDQYQLAVMASLYLVAKVQQTQALEPASVAKLSRGKYTKADIEIMELEILCSLKWFVNPPTPMAFANEFIEHFDFVPENWQDVYHGENESIASSASGTTGARIMELVKRQIQEAICDYELSCRTRPSHVAYGAFSNALESMDIDSTGLESMRILRERLQIDDGETVSAALLQAVSSSDSSNDSLSCLLLHRCSLSRRNSQSSEKNERLDPAGTCFAKTSTSSVYTSPRTVTGQIVC